MCRGHAMPMNEERLKEIMNNYIVPFFNRDGLMPTAITFNKETFEKIIGNNELDVFIIKLPHYSLELKILKEK